MAEARIEKEPTVVTLTPDETDEGALRVAAAHSMTTVAESDAQPSASPRRVAGQRRAKRRISRRVGRLLAATDGRLSFPEASLMTQLFNPAQGAFFDLSPRVKLRITGADALRFLNGQISNDLRKATADFAIQASVLSAKGKLNANVFISAEADSFVLDADPEVREELPARIERYIIADDVQIEDVTDRFAIFHITGEVTPVPFRPSRIVQADRFGCSGWDIWLERAEVERVRQELSATLVFCDEECAEVFRIERGIPRWGRELTDQIIPTEANLEATSIDYSKGCYIGQEVISRIKMSGQTNKRLCGLVLDFRNAAPAWHAAGAGRR